MKVYLFAYREWAFRIAYSMWYDEKPWIDGVFVPTEHEETAKWALTWRDDRDDYRDTKVAPIATLDPKNLLAIRDYFDPSDLLLFYGWSWMVPPEFTEELNCICLHPSMLPKYRGGSPIQNQVLAGETTSGVTLFKMGIGLDDGPIFYQEPISLSGNLSQILHNITDIGFHGTLKLIRAWKDKTLQFTPQDEVQATFCKRRKPSDSQILPTETAEQVYNKVRCLQYPYPAAYLIGADGKKIYIKQADYEK